MSRGKTNPLGKQNRQANGLKSVSKITVDNAEVQTVNFPGLSSKVDFQYEYGFDFVGDYSYDCEEYGCDEEGICRCTKISDPRLGSLNYPQIIKSNYGIDFDTDKETAQAISRVLHKCGLENDNNWRVEVEGDYYGDEMGPAFLDQACADRCDETVRKLLSIKNVSDRTKFANQL